MQECTGKQTPFFTESIAGFVESGFLNSQTIDEELPEAHEDQQPSKNDRERGILLVHPEIKARLWNLGGHFAALERSERVPVVGALRPQGRVIRQQRGLRRRCRDGKKHGVGTITQILHDRKRVVRFDSGGEHRYNEHSWSKLAKLRNVTPIRADHLLTCVLRQELDLKEGKLE